MQPEQCLDFIRKRIKKEWNVCFLSVIFFGLLAHIYKFTNFIPNWDSLLNLYTDQDKLELGRGFLAAACSLSSYYDLPWINGMFSLIYIGAAAVCIVELFHLKKTIPIVLTGGLLVTFPTVTSTLAYNYTADGYFLALLCMCMAVLLIARIPKGIFPAIFLMAFGLGIYQAYISFAMVLILVYLIDQLLFCHITKKQCTRLIIRFGVSGILSGILYYAAMQCRLRIAGTALSEYQSIDQTFSLQGFQVFRAALSAGYRFLKYFFDFSQGRNLFVMLNIMLWLMLILLFLAAFRSEKTMREPWRILLICICIAAIPFASYVLYFANTVLDYHNLMVMCICLIYLLPVFFYERLTDLPRRTLCFKQYAILAFSVLEIINFTLLANISYQKMDIAYEKSYGVIIRLADRIEQMPEAAQCKRIAVYGCLPESEAISVNFPPDMTGITDSYIIRKQDTMMHENVTQAMLKDYCGLVYEDTTEQDVQRIKETKEFRQMKCWPAQNSVAVIEDTLVIQFGEEEK